MLLGVHLLGCQRAMPTCWGLKLGLETWWEQCLALSRQGQGVLLGVLGGLAGPAVERALSRLRVLSPAPCDLSCGGSSAWCTLSSMPQVQCRSQHALSTGVDPDVAGSLI